MVFAAAPGTRLRPLTYEIPKPMVPVFDRPVMAHVVDLLDRHGIDDVIANLHHFPETISDYFGDRLTYRYEEEPLGTAGGARNCADFLGDESFLVMPGHALTDIDLEAFAQRHREAGGIATLAVKRVADTREYGVVLHDRDGRVSGFQEKPEPAEALSDLGNCGIYIFEPAIFDYFPAAPFADWATDVFPALLDADVPFHVHELDEYWNDLGSLDALREGTFDALEGRLQLMVEGEQLEAGLTLGDGTSLEGVALVEPPVWLGRDVTLGADVRLQGPVVLGDGVSVGDGAALRDAVLLPGTEVAPGAIVIGAIAGHAGIAANLRTRYPA
jgi:mannose-1-phosphate guanylyltransferase/mannose-1-phosphate guanylyltransferase/phosphomannomutase